MEKDLPKITRSDVFSGYADIRVLSFRPELTPRSGFDASVEGFLGPGWTLLAITHTTGFVQGTQLATLAAHDREFTEAGPIALFVFGKARDAVVDELTGELRKSREAAITAQVNMREAQDERDKFEQRVGALEGDADRMSNYLEAAHQSLHEAQERYRALEEDLAKVRKHFGDKAMQEALDGSQD